MPNSPTVASAAPVSTVGSVPKPFLLTSQQGDLARRLLAYVVGLALPSADAQLLATVLAIRAAQASEVGNLSGQDLRSLRLGDSTAAVSALAALGWQFGGDLAGGDLDVPVPVGVPGVREALPAGKLVRSRVSGGGPPALWPPSR